MPMFTSCTSIFVDIYTFGKEMHLFICGINKRQKNKGVFNFRVKKECQVYTSEY